MMQKNILIFLLSCFTSIAAIAQDTLLVGKYYTLENLKDTISFDPFDLDHFQHYRYKNRAFEALSGNIGLPTYYLDSLYLTDYNGFFQGYYNAIQKPNQIPFYHQKEDVTLLEYTNGANSEQYFHVMHSNQFGEGLNVSFDYNRIISQGFYLNQLTDNTHFNLGLNYNSRNNKYFLKAFYQISNIKTQENGGVEINDTSSQNLSNSDLLSINLNNAKHKLRSQSILLNQKLQIFENDFLKSVDLFHQSNLSWSWKWYKDNGITDYYKDILSDSTQTFDSIHALNVFNSFGLSFFNDMLSAEFEHLYFNYFQDVRLDTNYVSDFIKFSFNKQIGKLILRADYKFGIYGFNSKNQFANAILKYSIDSISSVDLAVNYTDQSPFYFQDNFNGNHIFYRNHFENEKLFNTRLKYNNFKYNFSFSYNLQLISNQIYYDKNALAQQNLTANSINKFTLNKLFDWRNFKFNNQFNYQIIKDKNILPLPNYFSKHSIYYQNEFFKKSLLTQLGFDLNYIDSYKGYGYFPESAVMHLQDERSLAGFAYLDVFVKIRIQNVRVFAKMENLFGDRFKDIGMQINDYPIPGRAFKVGLSWAMFN